MVNEQFYRIHPVSFFFSCLFLRYWRCFDTHVNALCEGGITKLIILTTRTWLKFGKIEHAFYCFSLHNNSKDGSLLFTIHGRGTE